MGSSLFLLLLYLWRLGLEKKLAPLRGEHPTLEDALKDAEEQLKLCREYVVHIIWYKQN